MLMCVHIHIQTHTKMHMHTVHARTCTYMHTHTHRARDIGGRIFNNSTAQGRNKLMESLTKQRDACDSVKW